MHEQDSSQNAVESLLVDGIAAKERKDFGKAASLFTDAVIQSQEMNYPHGVLHGLMNMGTIWRIKARETGSVDFAHMARSNFAEAVSYAERHEMHAEEIVHSKFLLGQAEFESGNFTDAISLYQESFAYYEENPRSTAHTGDVQRHLGIALVKSGQVEEGITMINDALQAIRAFDESDTPDKRNYVWEAGALLALSDVYTASDPERAMNYAKDALKVSEEHDLVIRKEEAHRVLQKLSPH